MPKGSRAALASLVVVAVVILLSFQSTLLWGTEPVSSATPVPCVVSPEMTIDEFGRENSLCPHVLKDAFDLKDDSDFGMKLGDLGLPPAVLEARVRKAVIMSEEYESKNWVKIPLKIALWAVMLGVMFHLMRAGTITGAGRKWAYAAAVLLFGVALGHDPSPMATLKDTIALYGEKKVIFPPRAVVLIAFLIIGIMANKLVCAWGCQFGTLQDLLFRTGRDKDGGSVLRRFKLPFAATNTVRAIFFILFTVLALGWAVDIIAPIDPFKIYNPAALTVLGASALGLTLVAGFFVYRPWCHLFCPFGFIGWITEKASVFKIQVNYDTCIACEKCLAACPSLAMEGILKDTTTKPDCFACGSCIEACPTRSIEFRRGERSLPPAGKFEPGSGE